MPFDPDLAARLPALAGLPPYSLEPPTEAMQRASAAFGAPVGGYVAPDVPVASFAAPGPHGPVPLRVYGDLTGAGRAGLVWCHGGAYVFGDLDMPEADVVARELAARDLVVASVDYRHAVGGVHFPVPHDDVLAAWTWVTGAGSPVTAGRWSIGGASAGANLAAGVALRLRDDGAPAPHALVTCYPVMHPSVPTPPAALIALMADLPPMLRSPAPITEGFNENYLGPVAPGAAPPACYALPGLAPLVGLPPTLVVVDEYDDLRPSGERFAEQLAEVGALVTLEQADGVPHGHLNIPGLPAALTTIASIAAFVG